MNYFIAALDKYKYIMMIMILTPPPVNSGDSGPGGWWTVPPSVSLPLVYLLVGGSYKPNPARASLQDPDLPVFPVGGINIMALQA